MQRGRLCKGDGHGGERGKGKGEEEKYGGSMEMWSDRREFERGMKRGDEKD